MVFLNPLVIFHSFQKRSVVLKAQQRAVLVEVPRMGRIAAADETLGAVHASGAVGGAVFSEGLETVEPNVQKIVRPDVPLDEFGPVFDVQTRANVAVAPDAGGQDPRPAEEVMIADHALVFDPEVVRAAERDFHFAAGVEAFGPNERDQLRELLRC